MTRSDSLGNKKTPGFQCISNLSLRVLVPKAQVPELQDLFSRQEEQHVFYLIYGQAKDRIPEPSRQARSSVRVLEVRPFALKGFVLFR